MVWKAGKNSLHSLSFSTTSLTPRGPNSRSISRRSWLFSWEVRYSTHQTSSRLEQVGTERGENVVSAVHTYKIEDTLHWLCAFTSGTPLNSHPWWAAILSITATHLGEKTIPQDIIIIRSPLTYSRPPMVATIKGFIQSRGCMCQLTIKIFWIGIFEA